jgi:hypothetical protein
MSSPILYNTTNNILTKDKTMGIIIGNSVNYNITKRFAFSLNYKKNYSTNVSIPNLNFFLIGSRVNL